MSVPCLLIIEDRKRSVHDVIDTFAIHADFDHVTDRLSNVDFVLTN